MFSFKTETYLSCRLIGGKMRRLNASWLKENPWMRYSPAKDAMYCAYCTIFGKRESKAKHSCEGLVKLVSSSKETPSGGFPSPWFCWTKTSLSSTEKRLKSEISFADCLRFIFWIIIILGFLGECDLIFFLNFDRYYLNFIK